MDLNTRFCVNCKMAAGKLCRLLMVYSVALMLGLDISYGKAVPEESQGHYEGLQAYPYGHEYEDPRLKYYNPQKYILQQMPSPHLENYYTPMINGQPIIVPPIDDSDSDINKMLDFYNIKKVQHEDPEDAQNYKYVQYNDATPSKYAQRLTHDYKSNDYEKPVISSVKSKNKVDSENLSTLQTKHDLLKQGFKADYYIKGSDSENELEYKQPQIKENKKLLAPPKNMTPDKKDKVGFIIDKKHGGKNFYVSKVKGDKFSTEDYDLPLIHQKINVKDADLSKIGKEKIEELPDSPVFMKDWKKTKTGSGKENLETDMYTPGKGLDFSMPVVVKVKKVPESVVSYEDQSKSPEKIKNEVDFIVDGKHGGKNFYASKIKIPTEDYDLPAVHETLNVKDAENFSQKGKEKIKELDGYDSQVFAKDKKKTIIDGQTEKIETGKYTPERETDFNLPVHIKRTKKIKKMPGSKKPDKNKPGMKLKTVAKETKVTEGKKPSINKDFKDVSTPKDGLYNEYVPKYQVEKNVIKCKKSKLLDELDCSDNENGMNEFPTESGKSKIKTEGGNGKKTTEEIKPTLTKPDDKIPHYSKKFSEDLSIENLPTLEDSHVNNGEENTGRASSEFDTHSLGSGNAEEDSQSFSLNDKSRGFLASFNPNLWSVVFNPNAKDNKVKKCVTRSEESGFCTYIQNCPVTNIATSLDQLLNNACVVDEMFIGICCPEFPVQTIKVQWETVSNSTDKNVGLSHDIEDCGRKSIDASNASLWPWKAPLVSMSNGKIFCGGVVIADEYVLTAAHCTTKIPKNQILVRLGQHNDSPGEDYPVIEIKRHAQYNPRNLHNDIALLKLGRQIAHDKHAGSVCLPDGDDDIDEHDEDKAILLGWQGIFGKNSNKNVPELLEVMPLKKCREKMGMTVPDSMICTETRREEERTCNADSGAPLIVEDDDKYEVIGILTWNRNDCDPRFPSTFSRVSSYLGWIRKHAV